MVLSHDSRPDPVLDYANRIGLNLFELTWEELINLRHAARLSQCIDPAGDFAASVARQGFIDDYRGVRISKNGKRFLIEQATVWN